MNSETLFVSDIHELAAGKLAALFSRAAARDLYDVCRILEGPTLDSEKLRLAFVVYGGISRRDWRTVTVEEIDVAESDVSRQLVPVLKAELASGTGQVAAWTREMVATCRRLCAGLLPFEPPEVEFLEALNGRGDIVPELLTDEEELRTRIRLQPGLLWKAHNVREHRRKSGL